jgi:hypothetical protein
MFSPRLTYQKKSAKSGFSLAILACPLGVGPYLHKQDTSKMDWSSIILLAASSEITDWAYSLG